MCTQSSPSSRSSIRIRCEARRKGSNMRLDLGRWGRRHCRRCCIERHAKQQLIIGGAAVVLRRRRGRLLLLRHPRRPISCQGRRVGVWVAGALLPSMAAIVNRIWGFEWG